MPWERVWQNVSDCETAVKDGTRPYEQRWSTSTATTSSPTRRTIEMFITECKWFRHSNSANHVLVTCLMHANAVATKSVWTLWTDFVHLLKISTSWFIAYTLKVCKLRLNASLTNLLSSWSGWMTANAILISPETELLILYTLHTHTHTHFFSRRVSFWWICHMEKVTDSCGFSKERHCRQGLWEKIALYLWKCHLSTTTCDKRADLEVDIKSLKNIFF